jgi:segregation and condensation protein B
MNLLGVLEGILFVVGDEGITLNQICEILNVDLEESKRLLMELKKTYETEDRGIRISYLGDAFKLTTKKEHKEYYQKLIETPESNTLSPAALETLAIIAYNQPITRVEIDEMRGVNNVHMIRKLLAKGLIKEVGKSTMPGRPNLYGTTSEFLDYFGLSSISELPTILTPEVKEENEETELFTSIYKEKEVQDFIYLYFL